MSGMDSLYNQTNSLVLQIQSHLGRLSKVSGPDLQNIENEIERQLHSTMENCERLEVMVMREPAARKQNIKMKVDQLIYDCRHLEAAFKRYLHNRQMKEQQNKEREALLSQRFTTNASSSETSIMIDASLQHHNSLRNAHTGLDDVLGGGSSILASLKQQRISLKGVQKRILDIGNTLNLSNTVMRLIDKRGTQDKWILYGGMIVTCIVMYLVVAYLT